MCMSCGCWLDAAKGGDGNHLEDASKMPNVPTTKSPLSGKK